jgi:cysteine synthase
LATATLSDEEKRQLVRRVGADLNQRHGKRKFYAPREIGESLRRLDERVDLHCWAYCFFANRDAFDAYHTTIGEVCDYVAMKAQMLSAVTAGASDAWFSVDLSWLDWPDVDLDFGD